MYYLYRHIRVDKNQVFYIGMGKKKAECGTLRKEYSRAFCRGRKNEHWKSIVSGSAYDVEILFEHNDAEVIKEKEKEFIKLYGRSDLGAGTLCNLTNGGEGSLNASKITAKKRMETLKQNGGYQKMLARIVKFRCISASAKNLYVYDLTGKFLKHFSAITEFLAYAGITANRVSQYQNKNTNFKRFIFYTSYKGEQLQEGSFIVNENRKKKNNYKRRIPVRVENLQNGQVLQFDSITAAADSAGSTKNNFWKYVKYGRIYKKQFKITRIEQHKDKVS